MENSANGKFAARDVTVTLSEKDGALAVLMRFQNAVENEDSMTVSIEPWLASFLVMSLMNRMTDKLTEELKEKKK